MKRILIFLTLASLAFSCHPLDYTYNPKTSTSDQFLLRAFGTVSEGEARLIRQAIEMKAGSPNSDKKKTYRQLLAEGRALDSLSNPNVKLKRERKALEKQMREFDQKLINKFGNMIEVSVLSKELDVDKEYYKFEMVLKNNSDKIISDISGLVRLYNSEDEEINYISVDYDQFNMHGYLNPYNDTLPPIPPGGTAKYIGVVSYYPHSINKSYFYYLQLKDIRFKWVPHRIEEYFDLSETR